MYIKLTRKVIMIMKQKNYEILIVILILSNIAVWIAVALNVIRIRSTFFLLTDTSLKVLIAGLLVLRYFKFSKRKT